jgi:hypothetical protein
MIRTATTLCLVAIAITTLLNTCDTEGPGYWKFVSKTVAHLLVDSNVEFQGKCFNKISISLKQNSDGVLKAEIMADGHKGGLCVEFIILTSGNTSKFSFLYLEAKEEIVFDQKLMTQPERDYIFKMGLFVLRSCDNLINLPENLFRTLKLFAGGFGLNPNIPIFGSKIPNYQLKANIEWAKESTGFQWNLRKDPKSINIDKKNIKSGDYLSIIRFDGLDNLIHTATGSRSGHSTMAMWRDGELYVVESQDAWYWPRHGIQKNKWEDWIKWAEYADFNVSLIPLKEELRSKYDEKKAWEEFDRLEGLPYGYSNFLFGYIDTKDSNLPDVFDIIFISLVLEVLEKVIPEGVDRVFLQGLNMRLGTKDLNVNGIWQEIYKRQITLPDLMAVVEKEGWEYPTGENYVCSAFVVKMYKSGGLFGDLEINSTEFTPKDLYELNFFDVSGDQVPEECREFAPRGFCQITGKVDMDLGKMSWVEPYANMDETCPTIAPQYERQGNC